jgi:hypothetical protein
MRVVAKILTFFITVLLTTACLNTPIHAQGNEKERAKDHFNRGIECVEKQDYQEAVVEFQNAYQIMPHYSVLYNLGMAYVAIGRPSEAIDALTRYLSDGGAAIPTPRRDDVALEIKRQSARIAYLTVRVEPDGATVRVDDRELGKSPITEPIRLGIGNHTVAVSREGYQNSTVNITLVGEEKKNAQVVLKPIERVGQTNTLGGSHATTGTQRAWAWATCGTGITLGVASAVIFAWNDGRFRNWKSEQTTLDRAYQKWPFPTDIETRQNKNDKLIRDVHLWDIVNLGAAIAGGAFLVTGTVLFLTGNRPSNYDDIRMKVNRNSAALEWNTKW